MKSENQTIEVLCHSGYKADERPTRFTLNGNKLMVDEIIEQWRSPEWEYFKILADDGNRYLLKCSFNGEWMLEKMFSGGSYGATIILYVAGFYLYISC